ncbi:MAG: hydrogenase expression/formation protein HypE [Candidatus Aenigmarchaeota archaeon ex4484_56]|nr:MAG: hydrogenase expression/formation protein HypE [Candidatus Aenigmarchaeota archaeon ex4484_56]
MEKINLSHGAGGKAMQELINNIISQIELKKTKGGRGLDKLDDSGIINLNNFKFAFTTDSYTINPIFFRGGDIGKLSVCGTINDLAVSGAIPIALSLSFIIEDGFEYKNLYKIIKSINKGSIKNNTPIICGDTKIVEKGKIDKIIINTSGIGRVYKSLGDDKVKTGDKIIVLGSVGDHGISILAERFDIDTKLKSDCSSILNIAKECLKEEGVTNMKDPTRGGLAACLNEIADKSGVGIYIQEEKIPIKNEVKIIGDLLGIDPLQTACEGRAVIFVKPDNADKILKKLKKYNRDASIIGEVRKKPAGKVILETKVGGKRFLESPVGELYPRIC